MTAATSRTATGGQGAAVDAAAAAMGFLDPRKVESVTLVTAADTARTSQQLATATPSATWVIQFHDITVPNLGGFGPDEQGNMVALVNADTMKFLEARSD